ncbi:glycosyltransferase family 2 protein [Candidatus Beckwithbacteria bacterium]|nr:glycosyltransferase family 2 protein [Candidatus Beckwithbacteria bacterium]
MKLCIILPAYNEAQVIGKVLIDLQDFIRTKLKDLDISILVIDDGSSDDTLEIAQKAKVIVLHHIINRGLGGALATGLEFAKKNNFDLALTMDSDGQHSFTDIPKAIKPVLANQADVVIGSRMSKYRDMPFDRVVINFLSSLITLLLFGIWTTDSQSGFRVFNKKALTLLNLKTQRMEVSTEIFAEIKKNHLQFCEVPIKVIYTEYSRQKGQRNLNSINILIKLFLRLFR